MFSRNVLGKLAACILGVGALASSAFATPWSFGVMADTQWSGSDPTGNNVNSVAVNQVKACNAAFVNAGVNFVVQVGDLGDNGTVASLQTRLDANSALNAAGIPFYGLRGNHEDNSACQTFFNANYIPGTTATATVAVQSGTSNYSVTYNNTKIVLLDILTADSTSAMDSATTWMSGQLSAADHNQAFVFQHKNLLGGNHKDNAFGGSNDANPTQQNNFISTLQNNGVRYDISGHDHQHYRSMVAAPNGVNQVQQLICASDSYKYYTPAAPFSTRDNAISQQLGKTGYYIFTVDGPRVTGKYYESTPLSNGDVNPNASWTLAETFGYSTNGKEFLVAAGGNLAQVQDSYNGTTVRLAGANAATGSAFKAADGTNFRKDINTGWTDKTPGQLSNALTLWGTQDEDYGGTNTTAAFTVTLGGFVADSSSYIAELNADGTTWTPLATTLNTDGTLSASVNTDGTFVAVPEPATMSLLVLGGLASLIRRRK